MKAPAFWWRPEPGPLARLLAPLGHLVGAVAARRMLKPGGKLGVPVICVGNVSVGGSGKTPTALALAERLLARGARPFFLSRGYGARIAAPRRVDPARDSAAEVGDEPLLLARVAPTIVSPDRLAGARACIAEGADLIIMDDGLQNPALAKTLSFAVFDAGAGIGNGLCLPAGPLRAPLAAHRTIVDAAVLIADPAAGAPPPPPGWLAALGRPVLTARLVPDAAAAAALAGRRVLALAGIGRPAKFHGTLRALGAEVAGALSVGDHAAFDDATLARLGARAAAERLPIATTSKDMARLSEAQRALLAPWLTEVPVRLAFDDGAALEALLSGLAPASA